MTIAIQGGRVLIEDFETVAVTLAEGRIASIGGTAPANLVLRAEGCLVLPGIVDCHGDAFERHIMPRPGVSFDLDLALRDADQALLASGITTVFHGVTWSWEPGLRGTDNARALVRRIAELAPHLGADTRFHLRHETFNIDAEAEIAIWLAEGRIGVLAFNDHTEGTLKSRHRPDKIGKMVERTGLNHEAFMALVDEIYARKPEVPASVARLAEAATRAGVPIMSHDDMSPAMRREHRALGIAIAEFPINVETAREAAAAGEAIVFGAPNVVRGGSHTGCPAAEEMVRQGLCTILASDYYYPALPLAPFLLAGRGAVPLPAAWNLVSKNPAAALGLEDRGRIAPGLRGDLVIIRPEPTPRVVATLVAGRLVHLADPDLLGR